MGAVIDDLPRWAVMWLIALAMYAVLKLLTMLTTPASTPRWKRAAYLFAWPGMDAHAFLTRPGDRPTIGEWLFAAVKLSAGVALIGLAILCRDTVSDMARGWLGMIGIVFTLHFGLFHLLSCVWRRMGCDARPLMNWPVLATSLAEFWGQRWNRAFRDLTYRYLFRPLVRWGPVRATLTGFLVSGLVHELAITVPAGGGYGGPTVYFLIQGVGLLAERHPRMRHVRGRVLTFAVLVAPAYWLFPPPFIERIVIPFMDFLGSPS